MATENIDSLQIEIGATSNDAVQKLSELVDILKGLKNSASGGAGLNAVVGGLKSVETQAEKASKKVSALKSLLGAIGYRKIASLIGSAVTSINDYVETVNLFQVSMGEFYDEAFAYAELVNKKMGIDTAQWMDAQGTFMLMATGFGIASDQAYQLSESLTELAYDTSSLKNLKPEEAVNKLRSALAGELEPIRALGLSISEATLQEYALTKGITESVNAMTEQEKALLRSVKVLEDSTRVGYVGDFAKTLESPANAIRILKQQITELSRSIGSVFLPVIVQLIPYVQAFVSILTDAVSALATFVGFTMPEWDAAAWADAFGSATDAVNETTEAVQKLKKNTLGIDELNIIGDTSTSANGGVSDWASNLQIPDLWDKEAIAAIETKAEQIKQKMQELLPSVVAVGAAFAAWEVTNLITSLNLAKLKINELGNAQKTILAMVTVVLMYNFISMAAKNYLSGDGGIKSVIEQAFGTALGGAILEKLWPGNGFQIGLAVGVVAILGSIYAEVSEGNLQYNDFKVVAEQVLAIAIGGIAGFKVGGVPGAAIGMLVTAGISTVITTIAAVESGQIQTDSKEYWLKVIEGCATSALAGTAIGVKIGGAHGALIGFVVGAGLSFLMQTITAEKVAELKKDWDSFWNDVAKWWEDSRGVLAEHLTLDYIFSNIISSVDATGEQIGEEFSKWWKSVEHGWNDFTESFGNGWDKFWDSAGETVDGMINGVISAVETGLNWCIKALNSLSWTVPDWVPWVGGSSFGFNIKSVKLGRVDFFENGGFPDHGQMFIARESGPELVGSIGRRTAVANNDQIVGGIASGVKDANEELITVAYAVAQQIIQAINEKETNTYIDSRKITTAQNQRNRAYGV